MPLSLRLHQANDAGANRWINEDIKPLPPQRRTWTTLTYLNWWSVWQLGITNWQLGASLLAIGLSLWQTMICILIGRILTAALAVLNGYPGATWHIGFPVFSRSVWGVYGANGIVIVRAMLELFGFGLQSFVGGLCITAILGAIFPSFHNMADTVALSSNVTTQQLIGWLLFNIITVPLLWKRPEHSPRMIFVLVAISTVTLLGMLIWALTTAHGAGPLISAPGSLPPGNDLGWGMMAGMTSTVGSVILAAMSQSDFSRFARRPNEQVLGQWIAFVVLGTIVPLFGALIGAATQQIYGQPIWNPPVLLLTWLEVDYNAPARAGAFFAGVGLVCAQLGINVVDNGYSAGMDLAGLVPSYLDIRRGAMLTLLVSMALCPWELLASAGVFLTVLGSFSVVVAPVCGVQVAEYWLVRRRRVKLTDLYTADPAGVYHYVGGFNWRAGVAFCFGFVPVLPGFITSVNPAARTSVGTVYLNDMSVLYGFFASFVVHLALSVASRPRGVGDGDSSDVFGTFTDAEAFHLGIAPTGSEETSAKHVTEGIPKERESL